MKLVDDLPRSLVCLLLGNFSGLQFDPSDLESKILSQSKAIVFKPWVLELSGGFFKTQLILWLLQLSFYIPVHSC